MPNNVFINFQEKMLMNITVDIVPDAGFFYFPYKIATTKSF